ncbi:CRISPR-associated protein Cas6, subtype MYXAN [Burkholderiales bacterium JOSHI_001]|nr:CRISPR-associated protein Cas6, subtype MYXAN [Burkholderiales bacterium JOSHI_001]
MLETEDALALATQVDLVFPLAGRTLPRDHRLALAQALEAAAPWLNSEPAIGLHPVNLVQGGSEPALLSARARLLVRLPRQRVAALSALQGLSLDVAGHPVNLGAPHARELLPHGTLYAHLVAADGEDEAAFLAAVGNELDALDARCQRICGRRHQIRATTDAGAPWLTGFSLMLHGLTPPASLRVLEAGLGAHRRLGCGLFVPHRSAAAVGS